MVYTDSDDGRHMDSCTDIRVTSVAVSDSVLPGCQSDLLAIPDALPTVCLQGARLHAITEKECIDLVLQRGDEGRGGSIFTMNLDHLRRFVRDQTAAIRYRRASIVTADGMPLIWASRLLGT